MYWDGYLLYNSFYLDLLFFLIFGILFYYNFYTIQLQPPNSIQFKSWWQILSHNIAVLMLCVLLHITILHFSIGIIQLLLSCATFTKQFSVTNDKLNSLLQMISFSSLYNLSFSLLSFSLLSCLILLTLLIAPVRRRQPCSRARRTRLAKKCLRRMIKQTQNSLATRPSTNYGSLSIGILLNAIEPN